MTATKPNYKFYTKINLCNAKNMNNLMRNQVDKFMSSHEIWLGKGSPLSGVMFVIKESASL